jgi:hypothetical protein
MHYFGDEDELAVFDAFEIAPSLRKVTLMHPPNLDLRLPFAQLTSLESHNTPNDRIVRFYKDATNFKKAAISTSHTGPLAPATLVCSLVSSRDLFTFDPGLEEEDEESIDKLGPMFTSLFCPALEKLSIDYDRENAHFPAQLLIAFISCSPRIIMLPQSTRKILP